MKALVYLFVLDPSTSPAAELTLSHYLETGRIRRLFDYSELDRGFVKLLQTQLSGLPRSVQQDMDILDSARRTPMEQACAGLRLQVRSALHHRLLRAAARANVPIEDLGLPMCCAVCGWAGKLLKCSRCSATTYCGRDHQRRDWKAHKKACTARAAPPS